MTSGDGGLRIVRCTTVADMLPNFRLIRQLSPGLDAADHASRLEQMVPHRYAQAAVHDGNGPVAVSGYWLLTKLYSGPYIEIDNFVVDEAHRGKGIGAMLLDWLLEEGRRNGCQMAMLDAYVENFSGHRFYYRHGFHARGFHYLRRL